MMQNSYLEEKPLKRMGMDEIFFLLNSCLDSMLYQQMLKNLEQCSKNSY